MADSRGEIYLHYVWGTFRRMPLLVGDAERVAYAAMMAAARGAGGEVLALGGMPDHVHLAVRAPVTVSAAAFMQQVKGKSSTAVRAAFRGETFGWQDGYGVFSFSRSHLDRVVSYIRNQRRHHAAGTLWTEWETLRDAPHHP